MPSGDASAARFIDGAYRTVHVRRETRITTRTRPAGISRRPYSALAVISGAAVPMPVPSRARGRLISPSVT
jgi:hypothetical protein